MSRVAWRRRARNDLKRHYEFLRSKNEDAAVRASGAVLSAMRELRSTPHMGRPMNDGTGRREWLVPFGAAGYVVRYGVTPEGVIVVLRIWHTRESRH